ncbi:hypothetical protein [Clostridium sp. FP1]|uniref:hypothetical protein n=1 Tax=Clostridium sp. FP1 TaxID=2724076 RepID=UPI001CCC375F|nr:hypothetical protein [Clostridium sp. FP1]MBZ9633211.1 hypothetical protein [Clostridium sp. FP1]
MDAIVALSSPVASPLWYNCSAFPTPIFAHFSTIVKTPTAGLLGSMSCTTASTLSTLSVAFCALSNIADTFTPFDFK